MLTEKIVDFIFRTTYEQLPSQVVDVAKRAILESLAGSQEVASKKVKEYVKEMGGSSEAAIIASGFKSHASLAALANGTMAHVLDYDDTEWDWISHPSAVILPAVLATGERVGACGKEVLAAYVVGYEVGARLGLVCGRAQYKLGWHTTSTIGSLAACAAASKLLQLKKQKIRWALGITASLASGLQRNFGTSTKSLHAGHAAANGVMATLLAEKGFTAAEDILEGERGFCQTFGGGGKFEFSFAPSLGSSWRIISPGIVLKAYPCCLANYPSIDAAIHLKKRHNLQPDDITEVECRTNKAVPYSLPFHEPKTGLQAKFSLEYCVARALIEGKLSLRHFSDEAVRDSRVRELSRKVKYVHPENLPEEMDDRSQEVVVKLKDGNKYSTKVDMYATKGHPQNPLTLEEFFSKCKECASLALPPERVDHFLKLACDLDLLKDIRELMDILCFA